jgi:hypothetical protein
LKDIGYKVGIKPIITEVNNVGSVDTWMEDIIIEALYSFGHYIPPVTSVPDAKVSKAPADHKSKKVLKK